MNKKTQKGLVAAITATMGAGIVAPAAMAAVDPVAAARQAVERLESAEKYQNAKEIEACRALVKNLTDAKAKNELTIRINRVMLGEYTEATNAVKKAKETRTQKDVSLAYNEAVNLTNDDAVRKNALINALNVVQKELYTKVDKALAKADTELKQEYLNEAQAIIKDMLNPWRKPREAKYTQLQVKLYVNTRTALQTAKNSGLKADYEIAKALYENVKTVTNNKTVEGWVKNVLTPLFESIVLDSTNPVVTGVEEGKAYNTAVTPASEEEGLTATLTRNGEVVEYTFGDEIVEEGSYELNVLDANENKTTFHFTIDMTAPVFKYTGETTINVKYGEVFTLPTMEASELSAVITPVIVDENDKVVEKIDTKVPGMYTVTYTAVDAAGNQTELVLTVVVAEDVKINTEAVVVVNESAVQVKGLPTTVKEADLATKKITLTAGTTTLTATYVGGSLTTDGKATFVLDDSKKLTDAIEYTVTSDWANFTTNKFVAKIAATYIKDVVVLTSKMPANTAVSNKNIVNFTAKNQYGEDLALAGKIGDLHVTGTLNGVPFLTGELVETDLANGKVEINKDLVEGNVVSLTFTNKIGDNTVVVGTVTYTVIKAEDAVATTISNMVAKYSNTQNNHTSGNVATEVLPDDQITLNVDVKDQFNNPLSAPAVRWVVEIGDTLIKQADGTTAIPVVSDANGTFVFTAKNAGKVRISAYIANGEKVTYEVTIGAKALTSLTVGSQDNAIYNQDQEIVGVIAPNEGAAVTPAQIKFDVKATKTNVDVTPADVTVSARLRGEVDADATDANKNEIVIVAKSTKEGRYTITPYVGESLEKATAKASAFDVTTTIDQTVASIDAISFNGTELKVGKDVVKDIVFRNKHNEVVIVEDATVVVTPSQGMQTADVAKTQDGKKNTLTLNASAAGSYQVTVENNKVFRSYTLTFAAPVFTSINAGADLTGVVAGDPDGKAKYQKVSFLDQDGEAMNVAKSGLAVSVTGPNGQALAAGDVSKLVKLAKTYSVSDAGVITYEEATLDTDNVVAYKVLADASLAQGTYTVKIAKAGNANIADTFTVTVGAARVAKTVDVTPVATKVALNGQVTVKIVPKDQYGEFMAVGTGALEVVPGANFTASSVTAVNKDGGAVDQTHPVAAYVVTLTGATKGTNDVVVNVKDGETVLATNKVSMTVDSVASLINSVVVDTTGIKALYSTEAADPADITLRAIAKDVNGAVVPVSNNDLTWTVKSVTGKVGDVDATVASVGTIGLHTGVFAPVQNFKGSVTFEVQTANLKTATITLNFDKADETPVTGTTAIVNPVEDMVVDADANKAGIQVALDGVGTADAEANGAITFKLTAKDQYQNDFVVDLTSSNIIVLADDSSVVRPMVNTTNETITLTALSAGTANVYVQYNGDTIKLEVAVNQAAVDAVDAANKAAALQGLTDKISAAQIAHDGRTEGAALNDYVVGGKAALNTAITTATGVKNNANATTQQLVDATAALNTALTTFTNAAKVTAAQVTEANVIIDAQAVGATATTTVTVAQGETLSLVGANDSVATVAKVDATGVITVTSVANGTYPLTVQVKNAAGNVVRTVTVTVTVSNQI